MDFPLKLVVKHGGETRQVRIDRGSGKVYSIQVEGDEGSMVQSSVWVISRNGARWTLEIDGRIEDVLVQKNSDSVSVNWGFRNFTIQVQTYGRHLLGRSTRREDDGVAVVKAQMPGKVVAVLSGAGDSVEFGQGLVIIESMKMQTELKAPKSGAVVRCLVEAGRRVDSGEVLFEIE